MIPVRAALRVPALPRTALRQDNSVSQSEEIAGTVRITTVGSSARTNSPLS